MAPDPKFTKEDERLLATFDQRTREQRRVADGLCGRCGKPRDCESKRYCERCAKDLQVRMRERTGSKPWRPGGPGRPPKVRA